MSAFECLTASVYVGLKSEIRARDTVLSPYGISPSSLTLPRWTKAPLVCLFLSDQPVHAGTNPCLSQMVV
jgi:hypothetical protein